MKLNLLFLLLLFAVVQTSAQTIEAQPGANPPKIRLYQATVKTMSGETVSGIFYAITDSTLVFFANNKAIIQQFRAGQLPELDTARVTDVKRVVIRRKGQFIKAAGVGLGVSALLITPLLVSTPVGLDGIGSVLLPALLSPLGIGIGLVFGTVPRESEHINGKLARFQRIRNRFDPYTVVSQQRHLGNRTGAGR